MLTFPNLAPRDFAGWVDGGEAARKGLSIDDYAAKVAEQWRAGLAEWDQQPARIQKFRDAADVAIYTPGSDSGLPLSILQSLAPPPAELLADGAALAERISSVISGLLTLLGRDADPLQSREHILLSNLLDHAWREGRAVDLASLVATVQKPPIDKLGALDLETVFPAKARMELALAINGLLASPRFATWTRGEPLDAQRLLFTPEGKPRIAHRVHRASVRCRAHVRGHPAAQRGDRLDAAPTRHLLAARHSLYGRDLRLLPAQRRTRRRSCPCSRC